MVAPGFVLSYDAADEVIQAVPALLDRIEALEAERDEARAEVERRPERDFVRAIIADRDKAEARLARVHRKCDQGCNQQMNEGDHGVTCRQPWPCSGADEQEASDG